MRSFLLPVKFGILSSLVVFLSGCFPPSYQPPSTGKNIATIEFVTEYKGPGTASILFYGKPKTCEDDTIFRGQKTTVSANQLLTFQYHWRYYFGAGEETCSFIASFTPES